MKAYVDYQTMSKIKDELAVNDAFVTKAGTFYYDNDRLMIKLRKVSKPIDVAEKAP